ncbi:MAG: hypothetical protein A2045_09670 [Rhodocyclales bacterium GWA2_65_20]|nr:MAG: hypothetical protein A2045_09670 [Rhodocyclales bacterium GWA2_65_20]
MTASTLTPTDRASFNRAMADVLSEHATLRRLAVIASRRSCFCADDAMSLADAMAAHESAEARLFALPFLTRPPESVTATAARASRRCIEYTSGNFRLPDPSAAAALFIEALLAHIAAEEAWLAHEEQYQNERLRISA